MKKTSLTIKLLPTLILALAAAACGGGGGGGGGGAAPGPGPAPAGTTTISGSVTLSSTVAGAARWRKTAGAPLNATSSGVPIIAATVELYNADHPEWLYPVANALTDSNGAYTLSKLSYASNNGNAYTNGEHIPAANYTVISSKFDTNQGGFYIAVQSYVKKFDGDITGNDLIAQDRGATPAVLSMFGLARNPDGTFGGPATGIAKNAAIQVIFNTAMARVAVLNATSITDASSAAVDGVWKISSDLLSATFYPTVDLTIGTVYTVTVTNTAKNLYGNAISGTVTGTFKVQDQDNTPPNATSITKQTNVPQTGPILIAANEPLDMNSFEVTSTPSIGDKPAVIFVGTDDNLCLGSACYPYMYQIMPAGLLTLGQDYAITVSGTKDVSGNLLTSVTINFKTEAAHAAPTITATAPASNAAGVAVNGVISATFSTTMDETTFTPQTFQVMVTGSSVTVPGIVGCSGTMATFIPTVNFTNNASYTAKITTGVKDSAGTALAAEYSWSFSISPPAPTAPTNPAAVASLDKTTISWTASTGASSYNVYWSTTTGVTKSNGTKIANATSPYVHTGVTSGTTYYYVVTAVNGSGESAASAEVSATPYSAATIPAAPTNVAAASGNGQTTVTWTASSGATSYNIYWSTTTGVTKSNGTKIAGAASPHVHSGLTNGTTCYYVATAVNGTAESAESAETSATPSLTPPPPPGL